MVKSVIKADVNKLCNVIAKNLTFSTNWKLISISWKFSTCSNFSTNWKWKWMNRIQHGRKNVVGKPKFELIWKIIYLINQISSHVIKMASKKARLSETERFIEIWHEESLWNILSDNYIIRQEKGKCWKNTGKTRNDKQLIISLKCLFEFLFCEWEVQWSQRHFQNPVEHLRWSFLQE